MTEKEKKILDLIGRCERLENNLEVVSDKVKGGVMKLRKIGEIALEISVVSIFVITALLIILNIIY